MRPVSVCGSYQDVPFQKETRFNGDTDACLAVALNITAKKKGIIYKMTLSYQLAVETAEITPLTAAQCILKN